MCGSVLAASDVVTDTVIVQREHLLFVPLQLHHRSALVLVSLEDPADLDDKKQKYYDQ